MRPARLVSSLLLVPAVLLFPAFAAVIALQLETFDQPEFNSL